MGEAAAETRLNMLEMHEDLCPLCRRVVHCILPGLTHAVTADAGGLLPAQPAPSLEQLGAHLQAVLLVPDAGAGAPLNDGSNEHNTYSVCYLCSPHCHSCPHLGFCIWTRALGSGFICVHL